LQIDMLLSEWQRDAAFAENVTSWNVEKKRDAKYREMPVWLHEDVRKALANHGMAKLYTHQLAAIEQAHQGRDVMVVTPTASGKTLCYNIPVLDEICKDSAARALYLFPTKALSQDQVAELHELVSHLEMSVQSYTYDGDTPMPVRSRIREAGHIVVTNPDMLHAAILPHHTKWLKLFENLRYIVIDETHIYRGVFGSHVANVIRRLLRICEHYGSHPQFILSSATIANPDELGFRLIGRPVEIVNESGAPRGEKHVILYNPPLLNKELGIRRSSLLEARRIGTRLLKEDIATIAFVKARTQVEVLATYWKNDLPGRLKNRVMGYRGGYLPNERRSIEQGLRSGEIRGVVSTNALELGVDIGSLDASIIVGYPGTVASVRQQGGRAGRRMDTSVSIFIANSSAIDQYLVSHPKLLFGASPEAAHVYPDNLLILMDHLKCATYELPFEETAHFGVETTQELLAYLADEHVIHRGRDGRYFWMSDALPSHEISLRSAAQDNVVIVDTTNPKSRVIGETDRFSAMTTLHEEAIYLHQSVTYQVEQLDLENGKAFVRKVDVDYYTDAELAVRLKVLDVLGQKTGNGRDRHHVGEVMVNAMATLFKKIKFDTHENLGWGKIHLPEAELHTVGYWCSWETGGHEFSKDEWQNALHGTAAVMRHAAALHCMCAISDLHVAVQIRDDLSRLPTFYLYDAYPGGIGLSERVYRNEKQVFASALEMINSCPCETGCPSCVGPSMDEIDKKRCTKILIESVVSKQDAFAG
jgi:DEAD/DEAH box helicase domain-containing protein